jgi:hypothetical protein
MVGTMGSTSLLSDFTTPATTYADDHLFDAIKTLTLQVLLLDTVSGA